MRKTRNSILAFRVSHFRTPYKLLWSELLWECEWTDWSFCLHDLCSDSTMIQNRKRSTHNSKQYGFMVSQRTFVLAVPVKPGSSTCTPPPMEHVDNPNSHLVQTINLPSVCVSCADDQSPVLMLPCGHIYCRNCMSTLFEMSLKDRSLIPIKCCNIAVDENCFQDFLNIEDQQLYAGVLEEQQCTHKMYW